MGTDIVPEHDQAHQVARGEPNLGKTGLGRWHLVDRRLMMPTREPVSLAELALHAPAPGEQADLPAWVGHVPRIKVPVRVVWGLDDKALLPVQLDGIGEVGDDVETFPLAGVGHFAPWEAPDQVAAALKPFLTPA